MRRLVVFMQNPWFNDKTDPLHIAKYSSDVDYRRKHIWYSPFGYRLKAMFGEHFEAIRWYGLSEKPGSTPRSVLDVDLQYIVSVVEKEKPLMIVTMGEIARAAVRDARLMLKKCKMRNHILRTIPWHTTDHPNKRGVKMQTLREAFTKIEYDYNLELLCSVQRS